MQRSTAATTETKTTVSISPNGGLGVVRMPELGLVFTFTRKGLICTPKGATLAQSIKAQQIVTEAFASHRYTPQPEVDTSFRKMARSMGRTHIELTCPDD